MDHKETPRGLPEWLRERPVVRFGLAVLLAGRVIGSYKLLGWRHRLGLLRDYEAAVHRHHRQSAELVLDGVIRLQGLMIKIGQTIGSNPAAVPLEYISVLASLQDSVPPRPWRVMRPRIERALGGPVQHVFAEFDRRPVAAASLAQVYRARLKDGRQVAVKVLYPGIERLVGSDLRVLKFLLWLDSRFGGYPLEPVYNDLAENVPLEVDLIHEARAMAVMAEQAAELPDVVIPRVVPEHSSRRLLVMEWIEGIKVTNVPALRAAGIDGQRIADLLVDTYARQLFVHGFFHADPHPGNLFALPGDRLAIVDFGLTKRLTPAFRRSLAKLVRAMFLIDTPRMVEAFEELGFTVERGEDQRVWLATGEFFRNITDPSAYAEGAAALQQLNDRWARAVKANPFVAIPGDVTLVSRVFSLLTGVGAGMGAEPRVLEAILRYTAFADEQPVAAQAGGRLTSPPVCCSR